MSHRVLVVYHGVLPGPGGVSSAPVTGGALRARVHLDALEGAGHEVRLLARAQDGPGGFRSAGDLTRLARAAAPDWILCVAPEEAPALAGIAPLLVDLYAPRLLEAAWEGLQEEAAGVALRAVHAADEVLYSNPRQRWYWLGILGLAGWDVTGDVGRVVPLAALPGPERTHPARPRIVAGGHAWPWQDLSHALAEAVRIVGDRAEIHTCGLPPLPGTIAHGLVSRDTWLTMCCSAAAALDRYTPNAERALAYSFRQADYLGCGTPLIGDPEGPLAEAIRAAGAGWVDEPLEAALEGALTEDRSDAVRVVAAAYAPARTEAPLLAWTPTVRTRTWDVLRSARSLAALQGRARSDEARRVAAEAEVAAKRAEIEALNGQVRALAGSVEALSAAVADVASLRKETVQVLGARWAGESATAEHLRREVEILRADLAKKDAELAVAQAERDRVGRMLDWVKRKAGA